MKLANRYLVIQLGETLLDISQFVCYNVGVVERGGLVEGIRFQLLPAQHTQLVELIKFAQLGMDSFQKVLCPWFDGNYWNLQDFCFPCFTHTLSWWGFEMAYRQVTSTTYLEVTQKTYIEVSEYFTEGGCPKSKVQALLVANYAMGKAILYYAALNGATGIVHYYVSAPLAELMGLSVIETPAAKPLKYEQASFAPDTKDKAKAVEAKAKEEAKAQVAKVVNEFEEEFGDLFD